MAALAARRLKGTSVNIAHARSEANEKRKRTLLQEYRRVRAALHGCCRRRRWRLLTKPALQHGKAGGFIDRRFGETDATTDADEKALQRMQRLRQMQFGKASRFALAGASRHHRATRCRVRQIIVCLCALQTKATRRSSPTSAARWPTWTPTTLCRRTGCVGRRTHAREQGDACADAGVPRTRTRSSTTLSRASTTLVVASSHRSSGATARRLTKASRTLLRLRNPRKR